MLFRSKTPKRIEMVLKRDVSKEKMINALKEGIEANTSKDEFTKLGSDISRFASIFQDKDFDEKNKVIIDYYPEKGVSMTVNGNPRGVISTPLFSSALFKVWFGEEPADKDLKKAILNSKKKS